jgi:hypothetical protein
MNKSLFFGGVSGVVESCFSHPFDFYKIKYQEMVFNNKSKPHIIRFMINNIKTNGFFSLYRGFIPKIVGIIPIRTTFWGVQNISLKNLPMEKSMEKYVLAGSIAGLCQTVVETPAEVLKIQLMSNTGLKSNIIKNSFNGFRWNALRNSVFCAAICLSNNLYQSDDVFMKFMVNGSSAFTAACLTQPIDFMKTKYQINDSSFKLSFFKAIKDYKFKMFASAFSRSYVAFINMGIGSIVYNYLMENY